MVTLLALGGALALAYLLGAHNAREGERRRLARGDIARYEAELLRSRGRRMHPNPESAAGLSRIRFVRR